MIRPFNIFCSKFLSSQVNRVLVSLICPLILSASLASVGYYGLAWFALVPLILLNKSAKSLLSCFLETFIFLTIYNLVSFIWIFSIHPLSWLGLSNLESISIASLAWILPSLYQSLLLSIFSIAVFLIYQFKDSKKHEELSLVEVLILSFIWALIQYKVFASPNSPWSIFSIPVNQLAYSQAMNSSLFNLFSIFGATGIEILIVAFNLLLANLVHLHDFNNSIYRVFHQSQASRGLFESNSMAKSIANIFFIVLIFVVIQSSSWLNFDEKRKDMDTALALRLVQANLDRKDTRSSNENLDSIINLQKELSLDSGSQISQKDVLIWSEAAIPSSTRQEDFQNLLANLAPYYSSFLFGTYSQSSDSSFNSLELIDMQSSEARFYNKVNLVPFGEYTPFIKIFPESVKKLAHNTIGTGFDRGDNEQELLSVNSRKFASNVCFELLFPSLVREQVAKGAEFIVNVNDLSWFSNSMINDLFLAVAKVRALENRKDLVLVSNSGYSSYIQASGDISIISNLNSQESFDLKIQPNDTLSIYNQYGW